MRWFSLVGNHLSTVPSLAPHSPLITAESLAQSLSSYSHVWIGDCSFDLGATQAGYESYLLSHIPGAHYLHLDTDLSGQKTGQNGRHPLPDKQDLAQRLTEMGCHDDSLIVLYDRQSGMFAARLWWMLKWLGHARVVVLNGGLQAWQHLFPVEHGIPPSTNTGSFSVRTPLVNTIHASTILQQLSQPHLLILDARAADRYRGENETLDPMGGHIPGARNRFFKENLTADGYFKPAAQLRQEFLAISANTPLEQIVHQCGSGVTACHNLLAMEYAGLHGTSLYPGSWSEWCCLPSHPIATGSDIHVDRSNSESETPCG